MAGHNKWSKVKRLKGALDAKRGNLFSKLSREITVAARAGGGDLDTNFRLRAAVTAARAANMPGDTVERALKKGTGELQGDAYEELVYEGYGPGGVALLLEAMTDNRNRTAADLREIFSKHHGNLANSGSVAYLFHKKGQIAGPLAPGGDPAAQERVFESALEAGAEEFATEPPGALEADPQAESFLITTAPERLYAVAEALRAAGVPVESARLTYLPETLVSVTAEETAAQVIRLCGALEECEDVQHLHANFEFPADKAAQWYERHDR